LDGDITGAGTLIKGGAGKLTITGNNAGLEFRCSDQCWNGCRCNYDRIGRDWRHDHQQRDIGPGGSKSRHAPGHGFGCRRRGQRGNRQHWRALCLPGTAGIGLTTITMAGNTTVGASGPWDTDPVKNLGVWGINAGSLSTSGNSYSLTKVGSGQVGLTDATVDAALGNIVVQQGLLALQGNTSSLGNPTNTITIQAGGTVSFYNTAIAWDKRFVLFGNGATANLFNYNGANTIAGPVTLNGNCVIGAAPPARGAPVSLTLSGPISGTGSLIKADSRMC
jgi:hypothetical protein